MVIYEVTATVATALIADYEKYMIDQHIPDLIATGCFTDAKLFKFGEGRYRIHYSATDRESLNKYFAEHADRLRTDFTEHFPTGIELSREILEVISR